MVTYQWLLINGYLSMVTYQWLLINGYLSMVTYQWLLINGYLSMVTYQWLLINGYLSMVTYQWLLINGYLSMVTYQWLLINGYLSMVTYLCKKSIADNRITSTWKDMQTHKELERSTQQQTCFLLESPDGNPSHIIHSFYAHQCSKCINVLNAFRWKFINAVNAFRWKCAPKGWSSYLRIKERFFLISWYLSFLWDFPARTGRKYQFCWNNSHIFSCNLT